MMTGEENQACLWLQAVCDLIDWRVSSDCEGTAMQRLSAAYINTNESFAEGVVKTIDMPAFFLGHLDGGSDAEIEALAMLPPVPSSEKPLSEKIIEVLEDQGPLRFCYIVEAIFGRIYAEENKKATAAVKREILKLEKAGIVDYARGGGSKRFQGIVSVI